MSPRDILMPGGALIGNPGSRSEIREIAGDAQDAQEMFDQLTAGAANVTPTGYPGRLMRLADGSVFGLRPSSKSGLPTIDVNAPGIPIVKIKFT